MNTSRAIALLLCLPALGCSAIPPGGDPSADPGLRALARLDQPCLGRLGVAPILTITLASDERAKGWSVSASPAIRARRIRGDFATALEASGAWERVREMAEGGPAEAWREGDDFVASLEVTNLRLKFDGRNQWWIPNVVNWLFWMVPAWWVATEDYSLSLVGELTIRSGASGQVLARESIAISSSGALDEFDRGWHFFGFIYTPLDEDRWLRIATLLFPAAQRKLAVEAAKRANAALRSAKDDPDYAERTRQTLVLALGVSRYGDRARLPLLPYAASDARAVASSLVKGGVVDPEKVQTLTDVEVSPAAVRAAIKQHLARARPVDSVLVYFAGYGTRDEAGHPQLLLYDRAGATPLDLRDLADLLAENRGQTLLVVDAAFDGGHRSIRGGPVRSEFEWQSARHPSMILAARDGQSALAQEHLGQGLLTYHLLGGLTEAADEDRDQRLTPGEIYEYLRPGVVAESAMVGEEQTPRLYDGSRGFYLLTVSPKGSKKETEQ